MGCQRSSMRRKRLDGDINPLGRISSFRAGRGMLSWDYTPRWPLSREGGFAGASGHGAKLQSRLRRHPRLDKLVADKTETRLHGFLLLLLLSPLRCAPETAGDSLLCALDPSANGYVLLYPPQTDARVTLPTANGCACYSTHRRRMRVLLYPPQTDACLIPLRKRIRVLLCPPVVYKKL